MFENIALMKSMKHETYETMVLKMILEPSKVFKNM